MVNSANSPAQTVLHSGWFYRDRVGWRTLHDLYLLTAFGPFLPFNQGGNYTKHGMHGQKIDDQGLYDVHLFMLVPFSTQQWPPS